MLSEVAKVLASDSQHVWLERQASTQCSDCSANSVCGQGLLAKIRTGQGQASFKLVNTSLRKLNRGDQVLLQIDEQSILSLSFLFYLLPLAIMLGFMSLAVAAGLSELQVIFSTFFGLLSGIFLLKVVSRHNRFRVKFQPALKSP